MSEERNFRFLDTEADRKLLEDDLRHVRRAVLAVVERVPEDQWYEPRYHNWSLAAMLGHLQFTDRAYMLMLQMALVGLHPAVGSGTVDSLNNFLARIYKNRLVSASRAGIETQEERIIEFLYTLPVDKFSTPVYDPQRGGTITVEQAMTVFFFDHWQEHLKTLRAVEGISYEPPKGRDSLS